MKLALALCVALLLCACSTTSCWRQIGTDHPGICQ